MSIKAARKNLKLLVAKGHHKKVIEQLMSLTTEQPDNVSDQIYSVSATFETLKKQISFGTISDERKELSTNEITSRLMEIISSLEDPTSSTAKNIDSQQRATRTQKDIVKQPVKNASSEKQIKKFSLLTLGLLLVAYLAFTFSRPVYSQSDWIGQWNQSIETGGNSISKGILELEQYGDQLTGTSTINYTNGTQNNLILTDITLEEKNEIISGKWSSQILNESGLFKLTLANKDEFKGTYYSNKNNKQYLWTGNLINK